MKRRQETTFDSYEVEVRLLRYQKTEPNADGSPRSPLWEWAHETLIEGPYSLAGALDHLKLRAEQKHDSTSRGQAPLRFMWGKVRPVSVTRVTTWVRGGLQEEGKP